MSEYNLERSFKGKFNIFAGPCYRFAYFPGAITIGGDILKKIGDGYTAEHCKDACNAITEFVCVGALMQLPDTCFVTGYDLHNNYFSIHYSRICSQGNYNIIIDYLFVEV